MALDAYAGAHSALGGPGGPGPSSGVLVPNSPIWKPGYPGGPGTPGSDTTTPPVTTSGGAPIDPYITLASILASMGGKGSSGASDVVVPVGQDTGLTGGSGNTRLVGLLAVVIVAGGAWWLWKRSKKGAA